MFKRLRKRYLASELLLKQCLGAVLEHWELLWVLLLWGVIPFLVIWLTPHYTSDITFGFWYRLGFLTIIMGIVISACCTLTDIFSLRKKETSITWCQITILIAICLWIIGFIILFDFESHPEYATALGIIGTILAWILQDLIKGVVAFVHLRLNHLLCIDDWIQVPQYNVDGVVTRVTLTTVTIYNWDTTTSSIPTSVLNSDHFINLQKMRQGRTYGRRMFTSYIFDMSWFHNITEEEAKKLRQSENIVAYIPQDEIKTGMLNAQLFRLYLFHWLMNHPYVSQQPRLIVRWMEPTKNGLPLQVYAFITDTTLTSFEWQQSQIIEHIMESHKWFGLHIYQNLSCYGVYNGDN